MHIFRQPIVLVDVETTGSIKGNGRITEVACIRVEGGKIVDEFVSLVNPEQFIPYFIQNFTGIANEMVEDAPKFWEIAGEITSITKDAIFVAHNVWFDYNFIQSSMKRAGKDFDRDLLCTVRLSRKLFPEQASHGLSYIIKKYGIVCESRHRAYGDARVLFDWFKMVGTRFKKERVEADKDDLLITNVNS